MTSCEYAGYSYSTRLVNGDSVSAQLYRQTAILLLNIYRGSIYLASFSRLLRYQAGRYLERRLVSFLPSSIWTSHRRDGILLS